MTEFDSDRYKELKEEFIRVSKRVLKENISTNPETLAKYKHDIVIEYNALINYINNYYLLFPRDKKIKYKNELIDHRTRLNRCFKKLEIEQKFPEYLLANIDILEDGSLVEADCQNNPQIPDLIYGELETINEETFADALENIPKMAEEQRKFIALCSSTLNKPYSGDPLTLQSFLNGIELLEALAGTHGNLLVTFVKTRLEGKALECIPNENTTIANIKTALKETIKPDSSKVVEGKILALRFNPTKSTDFSDEATSLAEAFQRSLVIEGIPQQKAKSMAIEKTVELCRKNAKSETVKAILASKEFTDPAEVIAKLIVEANNVHQEKQILSVQQSRHNREKNYRHNSNHRNNNGGGRGGNSRYYSNKRNNNYQFRNNRGQQRGGRGYHNNNSRGNYNRNGQYVRVVADQGNGQFPSTDRRAIAYDPMPRIQMPIE